MKLKIYLVTNKVTHSRFVCGAHSPDEAKRIHPTNAGAVYKSGGWVRWRGGHSGRHESVPPPTGWTAKMELLHADELGVAGRGGSLGAEAYEASLDLRVGGECPEGPDSTWGGYTLGDL